MPENYDWVIIGQGSSALNYLYAKYLVSQDNDQDNFQDDNILLIGEADLWTNFYDHAKAKNLIPTIFSRMLFNQRDELIQDLQQMFGQLDYEIGQAANLDYTLNWWDKWMDPQQWNIDYGNRLIKAAQLDKGSPEYLLVGQYSYLQQRLLQDLQTELNNLSLRSGKVEDVSVPQGNNDYKYQIKYKLSTSDQQNTIKTKKVIIATGVPQQKTPKINKNADGEYLSLDAWKELQKKQARWDNKKLYNLAWNATDYVVEPLIDTIALDPQEKESERVKAIEQSKFTVLVDGGTPTGAWAVEKALNLGAAHVIWISKYYGKGLVFEKPNAWGRNAPALLQSGYCGDLLVAQVTKVEVVGEQEIREIEQGTNAPWVKVTINKSTQEDVPEPATKLDFIGGSDAGIKARVVTNEETLYVNVYIAATGPSPETLPILGNNIKSNLNPIVDTRRRLTKPEVTDDERAIVGLGKDDDLFVIGPAAFQAMKSIDNLKQYQERYQKTKELFPETTHTDDGITVTKAAIKVMTDMTEKPLAQLPDVPSVWLNTYNIYTNAIISLIEAISGENSIWGYFFSKQKIVSALKEDKPSEQFVKFLREENNIFDQKDVLWLFRYAKWINANQETLGITTFLNYYRNVLSQNNLKTIYLFNWNVTDREETFEFFKKLFNLNSQHEYQDDQKQIDELDQLNKAVYEYIYTMKYTGQEKAEGRQGSVYGWTPVEFLGLPNITDLYTPEDSLGPVPTHSPLLFRSWKIVNP
ncbi:MAG: hypothetical protein AB4062_15045 [Crocosphaera sp.]